MKVSASKSCSASASKFKNSTEKVVTDNVQSTKLSSKQNLYIKNNLSRVISSSSSLLKIPFSAAEGSLENSQLSLNGATQLHHLDSVVDFNMKALNSHLAQLEKEKHQMFKALKEILLEKPKISANSASNASQISNLDTEPVFSSKNIEDNRPNQTVQVPDGNLSPVSVESCGVDEKLSLDNSSRKSKNIETSSYCDSRSKRFYPSAPFPSSSPQYGSSRDPSSSNHYFYSDRYHNLYYNGEPNNHRSYPYDYTPDFSYPEYYRHSKSCYTTDQYSADNYHRNKQRRNYRCPDYPSRYYK